MKSRLGPATFAALIGLSSSAAAMSISQTPPHRQDYAVCEARKLVDFINGAQAAVDGDPDEAFVGFPDFTIYSDAVGKVGNFTSPTHPSLDHQVDAFDWIESLRNAHGKPDKGLIVGSRLVLLQSDRYLPVYLLTLRRTQWEVYLQYPTHDLFEGYQVIDSTWMIQFSGNTVAVMRQADELAPATAKRANLLKRRVDCVKLLPSDGDVSR